MKIRISLAELEDEVLNFMTKGYELENYGYDHYRDAADLPGKQQEWEQRVIAYLGKAFPTSKEAGQFRDTPITISPFPGMNLPVQMALNIISVRVKILGSIVQTLAAEYQFEPESWRTVVPELDWSEQSLHIRTLFRPWQPGDGYEEEYLQATEVRLGVHLPTTLRNFYRAWGRRQDLTEYQNGLLHPRQLALGEAALAFCVENQAACYWGVRREALTEENPPVVKTDSLGPPWKVTSELDWTPSHAHLSDFLDDLTYMHAFGGALHGGWTDFFNHPPAFPAHHLAWLEEHWSKAKVTSLVFGFETDSPPTLYVRDGQAFWECGGCSMAARDSEALDELGQRFQLTWKHRW